MLRKNFNDMKPVHLVNVSAGDDAVQVEERTNPVGVDTVGVAQRGWVGHGGRWSRKQDGAWRVSEDKTVCLGGVIEVKDSVVQAGAVERWVWD